MSDILVALTMLVDLAILVILVPGALNDFEKRYGKGKAMTEPGSNNAEPRCDICRFWMSHGMTNVSNLGFCRRRMPAVCVNAIEGSAWPQTNRGDWCGEHEPRPVSTIKQAENFQPTLLQRMP